MKSFSIKISLVFALVSVACGLTLAQTTNHSQQQCTTDSPCRIIIQFDSNIVPVDNQTISLDSIKSKELKKYMYYYFL